MAVQAEPEKVSLETRQAGLGSESCHSTSKCHQAVVGTEATLGLDTISSVTLYRIAQYKIPLAFNALYFPYSETTHLFGVNSTD